MARLHVFREHADRFERVGILQTTPSGISFLYDEEYLSSGLARRISLSLPLQAEPFTDQDLPSFFEGLLPEGALRSAMAQALHVDGSFPADMLAKLNDESIGGLVFSTEECISRNEWSYRPLDREKLIEFADHPLATAVELGTSSRLSLSGAQSKIGLYRREDSADGGWFLPEGSAPSNIIVKAAHGAFPSQTVNEAFCLAVARRCGFDTASAELLPVPNREPLLVVSRFDRVKRSRSNVVVVDGQPAPLRLHQEDFCQAAGLSSHFKYEPTDGRYLSLGARIISRTSLVPFGDKMMFFNRILFDYLIGNCDNHLKNHSLLWNESWSSRTLSPLYDVTCTTMYPSIDREMGVSLCPSRRTDDVTAEDIRQAAKEIGIAEKLGWQQYRSLCAELETALSVAEQEIAEQGFPEVHKIAQFVKQDSAARRAL